MTIKISESPGHNGKLVLWVYITHPYCPALGMEFHVRDGRLSLTQRQADYFWGFAGRAALAEIRAALASHLLTHT